MELACNEGSRGLASAPISVDHGVMGSAHEGGLVGPWSCGTVVRMSGKRGKHTPKFREQAGRWVVCLARAAGSVEDTGAVLDADERAAFEPLCCPALNVQTMASSSVPMIGAWERPRSAL